MLDISTIPVPIIASIISPMFGALLGWFSGKASANKSFKEQFRKKQNELETQQKLLEQQIQGFQERVRENNPAKISSNLELESHRIDTLKIQLEKLENNVAQKFGRRIEDRIILINDNLTRLSQDIETARNTLLKGNRQIDNIELDARNLSYQYKELTPILDIFDNLKDERDNIQSAGELLELVNNNYDASIILTELKKQISKVETKQKSQPIIKLGRIGLLNDTKGFIQTERLQDGRGNRYEPIDVKFDVNFSDIPNVYVALAMVDGQCDNNFGALTARVHVYAESESITKEGFTLVTKTWEGSKIHNIDAIWIAIGK